MTSRDLSLASPYSFFFFCRIGCQLCIGLPDLLSQEKRSPTVLVDETVVSPNVPRKASHFPHPYRDIRLILLSPSRIRSYSPALYPYPSPPPFTPSRSLSLSILLLPVRRQLLVSIAALVQAYLPHYHL